MAEMQYLNESQCTILVLVPTLLLLIGFLTFLNVQTVFEPPYLLLALNSIFLGVIPLFLAYQTVRTYLSRGNPGVLMTGTGMLIIGLSAIVAGAAVGVPGGANINVTIYNTCFFLAALLLFLGSLADVFPSYWFDRKKSGRTAVLFYVGGACFVILFTIATFQGIIPPFFIQGTGPTILRQGILASTVVLFSLSAVMFYQTYVRKQEKFYFWCSLSLAFFAIGLFSVGLQQAVGNPVSWMGRIFQYIGALLALVAYLGVKKTASVKGIPVEHMIARFFGEVEAGYQALVEASASAIVVIDPVDRVLVWNPAAERMFGYTRNEAIGSLVSRIGTDPAFMTFLQEKAIPPSTTDEIRPGEDHFETTGRRKDGSAFPIDVSVSGHWVDQSWARTCIIRDVTARNQAEDALRESEERLRLAQSGAHVGIWDLDMRTGRVIWTPEVEKIFGYEQGEFPGTYEGFSARVHPNDLTKVERIRDAAIEKHLGFDVDFRVLRPSGETRWVNGKGSAVYDASGNPLRVFGVNADITERKQTEESLKEYAASLKRSNEDLERFAYVASHDLREPLRMVTSFSQLLEMNYKGKLGTDADEFIGYIVEGGRRMDALVNDLLEFSRVTSRENPFQPTDLNELVKDIIKTLSIIIQENNAEIEVGVLPTVSVDISQISLVFQNLITNGIKFHDKRTPEINIQARRDGNDWVFSVKDNGIGIDPSYHKKIFEIFQRLHPRDQYPGTGIGLAICQRIIDRHGGRIWVESDIGAGSTFYFTIPADRTA